MAVSLAAWLAVVGMLAYYFEIVTPVSILANIFIVPLTSFLVVLGFGLLVLGQGVPFLAGILAVTIKLLLNITVALTYYFAQMPGAYFFLKGVTLWQVGVFYALFGILVFLVKDRQPPLADGLQLPDDDSSAPVIDKDK
jgi:competence protein ComEC